MSFERSALTSISLGNNVVSIGDDAFYECKELTSLETPNSLKTIGNRAFYGCISIQSIMLGEKVESIGGSAFLGLQNLEKVTALPIIPPSIEWNTFGVDIYKVNLCVNAEAITAYSNHEFWGLFSPITSLSGEIEGTCGSNLTWLYEDDKKTLTIEGAGNMDNYYGKQAPWDDFKNSIQHVVIKTGVTSIGNYAFRGCKNMISISIPNEVALIGQNAFEECASLKSIILPDGINSIRQSTFYHCSNLESVQLPSNLNTIESSAFWGCSSLSTLTIPNSVNRIGSSVFEYSGISSIIIPSEVTSIENRLFKDCKNLKELDIPENVISIGSNAFYGSGITSITIGSGVTSIGLAAFGDCLNLEKVIALPHTPPSMKKGAFFNYDIPLYVPQKALNNYNTTEPWSSFMSIIAIDDDTTYPDFIYEIGNDGGWFISHPLKRMGDSGVYMGYCYLNGEFKFKESENDWNGNSWGLNKSTGKVSNSSDADNFSAEAGFYQVIVDLEDMTLTLNLISSIGVIGSYSGWSEDTDMAYDFDNNVWKVEHILFDQDENYFKFRANHSWDINWGGQPDNIILGGDNLSKGKGAYTIELRLSYEGNNRAIVNKEYFKLTYKVDDEVYKTLSYDYGATITPEPALTKEGYIFSGWSEIPETMPAHDVTVTGTFTINKYTLTFMVGENVYETRTLEYGSTIIVPEMPELTGYTFTWGEVPATMPAQDVTIVGEYQPNLYNVTYLIDGQFFAVFKVAYGSTITPPEAPERAGSTFTWGEYPETMPAHDIIIEGTYTLGINLVQGNQGDQYTEIYTVDGKKADRMQRGVNIIRRGSKVVKVAR